ncbi:GMP synthase subunit A [archaeon]|nr:GMP synthase subunit A [archaeon]
MKILVIANRGQYNHRIYRTLKYLGADAKLVQNTISVGEVEAEVPDGIVVGGGPFLDEIGNSAEIIERFYKEMPILGICLGQQLIAKQFGGEVRTAEVGEYANCEIMVDDEDALLKGVGPKFDAWVSHKDEVSKIPNEFVKLAHSATCEFESVAHKKFPLYGVQFHPEVEHTPKGPDIFKNFLGTVKTA